MQRKHPRACQSQLPHGLSPPHVAPQTPPAISQKVTFHPSRPWPGEDIPQTRPPRCGAGSICVQARHRAWLQGCQCESPVRLGTWPANSKPLKSACAFIDHSLKAPATVSPGFPALRLLMRVSQWKYQQVRGKALGADVCTLPFAPSALLPPH